jgi:outer membrane protein assembly factor BamB
VASLARLPQENRAMSRLIRLALFALTAALPGCLRTPATGPAVPAVRLAWTFEPPARGAFCAGVLVEQRHVYAAAIEDGAFRPGTTVYCLERATRRVVWRFNDGGAMLHTISTPCLAGGRLYVGEGMHANFECKLYCLDAATGRKCWDFPADGHIESSPCVAGPTVLFGAGDDGLYSLNAITGKVRWHFEGLLHVDTSPVVAGGRVYAGSGISRRLRRTEAFCLDARTGRPLWRTPTDLPVWGSPVVEGGQVFFGLGNGRLERSVDPPARPAGALLCLDAATGKVRWRCPAGDGVLVRPAVGARQAFFVSRDGCCYAVRRESGALAWKTDLGGPLVAAPALAGDRLYLVTRGGRVAALAAEDGRILWSYDLADKTHTDPRMYSAPVAARDPATGSRQVIFGAELRNPVNSAAVLYCLEE